MRPSSRSLRCVHRLPRVDGGQEHGKNASARKRTRQASESDGTVVFLHNSFAHPQAKAGAFFSLRGEEWLKDSGSVFFGDSLAVVSNGDANTKPFRISSVVREGEGDSNNCAVRIHHIHDEVSQQLTDYAREPSHY